MFSFFKKDKPVKEEAVLSPAEKTAAEAVIAETQAALEDTDQTSDALAALYEKLGLAQAKLSDTDHAIASLEKSLGIKKSIGDGYKTLISLYNAKRAAAAKSGDDAGIEYYMNKMDDMRQIAKQITISGN
ncbi:MULTISPECIES: hypothetical protein [unclassified Enterococcus]|uniref:hypothetical protein n=1 Tax=unclassified Enterococcus TaxID=2608891 RepID=UPI0006B906B9|nr:MULTISPECIES: hypothetical protein [unclassified Enterococcus]KPG70086.1 hypothetical protein AEQ18_09285 [Enterococcus sp. RIT-PI-f]